MLPVQRWLASHDHLVFVLHAQQCALVYVSLLSLLHALL